jgi:hypothetical protein
MKFVRSILAIVVGFILAQIVIVSMETANFLLFVDMTLEELGKAMQDNPQKLADLFKTLPVQALVIVVAGWAVGSFLGGFAAALIAGWARCWHAGIIGGIVLLGTIANVYRMKTTYDISHPDWMIVAGLLLPLPMSLLAGKIVSMLLPSGPAVPQS